MWKAVPRQHVAQVAYAFGIAVKISKGHYSPRRHREIQNHCNPSAEVNSDRGRVSQKPSQNSVIPTDAERSERSGGTCFFRQWTAIAGRSIFQNRYQSERP